MADALAATQMALAREQKLTDLGGVVAAAAHELGTPLATIKLTSTELARELRDKPDLREDIDLIRAQTDRCRDILRNMGRAGKDDRHIKYAPVMAVIERAAEPHIGRGKTVDLRIVEGDATAQPMIPQLPEIVHGLRNLVQNAVDFAGTAVWIDLRWTDKEIAVQIADNGPGFPQHLLGRIGDPFMRSRRQRTTLDKRPEYEGMGLGLFIAKTLLERTGASLQFENGKAWAGATDQQVGAVVTVTWPRDRIEVEIDMARAGLGENQPFIDALDDAR